MEPGLGEWDTISRLLFAEDPDDECLNFASSVWFGADDDEANAMTHVGGGEVDESALFASDYHLNSFSTNTMFQETSCGSVADQSQRQSCCIGDYYSICTISSACPDHNNVPKDHVKKLDAGGQAGALVVPESICPKRKSDSDRIHESVPKKRLLGVSKLDHSKKSKKLAPDEAAENDNAAGQYSAIPYTTSGDDESNSSVSQDNLDTKVIINLKGKKTKATKASLAESQSIYARERREKINERLKILQQLVPNGTKVDMSTMLEEAVHYVKFLQVQIKLLSSDDHWMYAPIAYNGMDMSLLQKMISPTLLLWS